MDASRLSEAFNNFALASKSLETYYNLLQERVRYLSTELEQKNRELNIALEEAEKNRDYLNAILYNLEEAIIVLDTEGRINMINKAALRLLQSEPEEILGRSFSGIDFTIEEEGHDTILYSRGKRYNVILSHSHIVDASGLSRGSVILIKDITRLRELEIQQERNQRLIAMGEMAAKIVHEIRNPLCSIELFATMLEGEISEPSLKELAKGISTGISNLNNILTNMLFFARPHRASMKIVNLDHLIEDSLKMLSALIETRNINLHKEMLEVLIPCDPELIKQVLMNLIVNAIQAVEVGGKIGIKMSVKEDEQKVIVEISDSGIGIKKEYIEMIFDPFFTTKDRGTGLGLTIAAKIMQAHGGFIKVMSEEGRGSTFSLHFPLPMKGGPDNG